MTIMRNVTLFVLAGFTLSGCVAAAVVPGALAVANLVDKSGTSEIVLRGPGGVQAFERAAVSSGCTVPTSAGDYARAECSDVDVKVEAQVLADGAIRLLSSGLSSVARTYEFTDNIGGRVDLIAEKMTVDGFAIISRDRNKAIKL